MLVRGNTDLLSRTEAACSIIAVALNQQQPHVALAAARTAARSALLLMADRGLAPASSEARQLRDLAALSASQLAAGARAQTSIARSVAGTVQGLVLDAAAKRSRRMVNLEVA